MVNGKVKCVVCDREIIPVARYKVLHDGRTYHMACWLESASCRR